MNRLTLAALALAAVCAAAAATPTGGYTTKYDNVDLDEILGNERLLKKYVECMLADNDSRCTPDGKELRKAIPDALTNECAKCSEKQKKGAEKVIRHLIDNRNADWKKLEAKYDPQGTYIARYRAQAAEHGVAV